MLRKSQRLTTAQFDTYFSTGQRVHGTYLQLVYTPHRSFHAAVVVGKKVHKRAVDRNKTRRRLYAALYRQKDTAVGVYIVLTKPAAAGVGYQTLATELALLLKRV